MTTFTPYQEPLRTTLLRTITIALIVGLFLALRWGGLARWPLATLLALWPSLGGHFVELFFLNHLRQRLPTARPCQIGARLAVWFIGGALLGLCMSLTALAIIGVQTPPWRAWWLAGLAFIGIELVVHLFLQFRRCPSFYNGRG